MKNSCIIFFFVLTILIPREIIPWDRELNFVLVYPELTKEILYNTDSEFLPTDEWELFLMSNHLKYRMVKDRNLDEINSEDDVIIIPSLEVVTEDMIENIEHLLKEGKGLLITGNFAKYNDEGNIIREFQKRILDLHINSLPVINSISINHTLKGNTPFSFNLKPGIKILLNKNPGLFYGAEIAGINIKTGYFFPEDKTFPDTLSGIISEYKFIGRLLWLGFNFNQMIGNERDKFLSNSFDWLASKPGVFINYLPDNYTSAGLIYKNVDKPSDLKFKEVSAISQKINFFISPSMLDNSIDEIETITDSSNIEAVWDDFFFSNKSSFQKNEWLKKARSKIGNITKQNYFGISSFNGANDSTLYKYLNDAGFSFVYSPGYSNCFSIDYDSTRKIYYFINSSIPGLNGVEALNFIINNNGIFYLNADSLVSGGNFKSYTNYSGIWITTFSDLLNWTLQKNQIEAEADFINDQYRIKIRNKGSSDIENLGLWLSLSDTTRNLQIKNYDNIAKLTYDNDMNMYFLKINLIKSYQNLVYEISREKF